MRQLWAFIKKEWIEQVRTGKFWILLILFIIFGILSPALAKLTPWLFELMADAMEEQGLVVKAVEVTALTSWQQFYKNISMMVIVMAVMASGVLTGEYQKGTLVNMLTKGLPRWKVIASKSIVQILVWTVCYWSAFGITLAYTAYFWDNEIAKHWLLAGFWIYLFGIWLLALIFLISAMAETNMSVLVGVGIVVAVCYFVSMIPDAAGYFPVKLLEAGNLLNGAAKVKDFTDAAVVTCISAVIFWVGSVIGINHKKI